MKIKLLKYILYLLMPMVLALTAEAKPFVVVIDPGHGGKDYGAIGGITNEKSINLKVAKKFGEKIRKNYNESEVKIVYTRSSDKFVALNDRAKIANDAKGDLFVSIHVNSLDRRNKRRKTIMGTEVYTCGLHRSESNLAVAKRENSVMFLEEDYSMKYKGFDPNSPESNIVFELNQSIHLDRSIEFASLVKKYLTTTANRQDKGVKQAGFWVLWSTGMPSVLIELDFISNPKAEKFMASADGVEKMSKSLYQAFDDYYVAVKGGNTKGSSREKLSDSQVDDSVVSEKTADEVDVNDDAALEYRVQVLANETSLSVNSKLFKGEDVSEYYDKGLYKYTVGHFESQVKAEKALRKLKSKFPQAFIIKMKNGKRVY